MYTETSKTRMLFTHTDFVEACHKIANVSLSAAIRGFWREYYRGGGDTLGFSPSPQKVPKSVPANECMSDSVCIDFGECSVFAGWQYFAVAYCWQGQCSTFSPHYIYVE